MQSADKYSIMKDMVDKNKRVYVYFNLHKKVWSIRQGGRVVEHTKSIMLKDCKYLVGKSGRERVLSEGRKNVHAGVSGYVTDRFQGMVDGQGLAFEVTYNPYKYKTFVTKLDPTEAVEHSDYAVLTCGSGWRIVEAIWK